jgi:hypothetical protein
MGIAEFIIGPAEGRTRWLNPSYTLKQKIRSEPRSDSIGTRLQRQSLVDARDSSFQSAPCFCQFIKM